MATSKQQRDAERRRYKQAQEAAAAKRKRLTAIAASVLVVAVIAAVFVLIRANSNGSDDTGAASSGGSASTSPSASASASQAAQCGTEQFAATQVRAAKGATVSFAGVKVVGAKDLGGKPGVTSKASAAPSGLRYKDLVVGTGKAAGPTSCVTVQYDGVLYKSGKEFDSSWSRGMLAQFPLTGVVPGFTQGIGGTDGVPPMKVGGRRVVVLPASLGYGAQGAPPTIPGNAPLVFVIDLTKVSSAS